VLKHKYKISAFVICLVFFFLALFSSAGFSWKNLKYSGNGILADEIPHIASGYYYLKTNRYFLNPEHPPLVKDIAGLGELAARPVFPEITNQENLPPDYHRAEFPFRNATFPKALEWQNNQDHFGTMYLFNPQNDPDKIAFWARLTVILANTFLLFVLFWLLKKIWSERAALLGLFFFAVSQFSIAHGSFVVIDFMSAVLSVIAVVCFALYLKNYATYEKKSRYFWLASVTLALALLSKFSSVVLVPALFLGGLVFISTVQIPDRKKIGSILKYFFAFSAIVLTALVFISVFYAFHVYKMEDSVLVQKINDNYPEEQLPAVGHKILELMVYSNPLLKGLAEYANGVFMVMSRVVVSAQNTYFLGHVYGNEGAGGWYFPVLYLAKLPPGLHFFSLLALLILLAGLFSKKDRWKDRFSDFIANPLAFLLFVFAFCYMIVTFSSTFQIGLRHIMPVILCAALLTGKGANSFWEQGIWKKIRLKHLFLVVSVLMAISVFCSFPYYLEYYNVFAGGTDNGYKVATDSNYDWGGSDVRRLGEWLRERNIKGVYTQIFADVPLKYYLGDDQKFFNLQDEGKLPPEGTFVAVSIFEYMNNIASDNIPPEHKYTILKDDLVARVGKTILVFRVP